jgi:hypothetical protein
MYLGAHLTRLKIRNKFVVLPIHEIHLVSDPLYGVVGYDFEAWIFRGGSKIIGLGAQHL